VLLNVYHDKPSSSAVAEAFQKESILEKLKVLDARVRKKGLESLDPRKNPLIRIGMEIDESGRVTKNSYGVFNLSCQAAEHPEWPATIASEIAEIRKRIRQAHGVTLRFLIWAGMGGSAEDKSMYNAMGLLRRGPRCYVLDSTDPAKLNAILADMQRRGSGSLADVLKSTLVIGQALGMTSYEPVVNLEKLSKLYEKYNIDSTPNFVYMTLPDSLLDRFGKKGGYRRVELQLDGNYTTSGRHSSPMTRGSLYALAFASVPLEAWMDAARLPDESIHVAWRLAAFLNTQAEAGRNKVTLLLPRDWSGVGLWTKQDFEESLGKSASFGLKIIIDEPVKLANYRPPKDPAQDRCFMAVRIRGMKDQEDGKVASLRRAGYPVAILTMRSPELSCYMQFIHYAVFGIAYLQGMNFVTQPGVELYKAITNKLFAESERAGGIEKTAEWNRMQSSPRKIRFRSAVTLSYDRIPATVDMSGNDAPTIYAAALRSLTASRRIEYGELSFFGDMRYGAAGKALKKILDRAGDSVFRSALKVPVDIYEGPAMNHSYHEMIIGHGRCFSTVLLSEKAERIPAADYTADYHRAQFLATQMALAERERYVVALLIKDLEAGSLAVLDDFSSRSRQFFACASPDDTIQFIWRSSSLRGGASLSSNGQTRLAAFCCWCCFSVCSTPLCTTPSSRADASIASRFSIQLHETKRQSNTRAVAAHKDYDRLPADS
jgi:glucose-6-phosphate isomerase